MGKFTFQFTTKNQQRDEFTEDCTRDEVIKELRESRETFGLQAANLYLMNGDIQVHMSGTAYGDPYVMNGYFTNQQNNS